MPTSNKHTRIDLELIAELINDKSSVLDLGCGDGDLLHKLVTEKSVKGHGVELHHDYLYKSIEKGVPVIQADLDEGLNDYPDNSFDYVVLSQTIQVVHRPDEILLEMLRVGKTGIVSVINFGYWKVRRDLLFGGRMPKNKVLPFEWYNTPNIHLSTIKDFQDFCQNEGITIKRQINLIREKRRHFLVNQIPNLFADLAIFVIEKNEHPRKPKDSKGQ
jgi:methionine biosynthesis protein MetW